MGFIEKRRTAFLGLPLYFTTYFIEEQVLNRKSGLFKTVEDDIFMYKIQDVKLIRTLLDKIFKLGTVICYTSDVTDATLVLKHIKKSKVIKEFIMLKSEEQRRKRKTLHTIDLDYNDIDGTF